MSAPELETDGWRKIADEPPPERTPCLFWHGGYGRAAFYDRDKVERFVVDEMDPMGRFRHQSPSSPHTHWHPIRRPTNRINTGSKP